MGGWFQRTIVDNDRLALFLCFCAFIVTFVATRVVTRTIRSGRGHLTDNVLAGGLHVHHAVPGVILLVIGALMSVGTGSESPWAEIAAVLVGVGTSLVLDEFALILHLQDVYWSEEGRISVEMVSLAIAYMGLTLVLVCVLKGKYRMALFGTFIPPLAFVCALRLGRPTSLWAERSYSADERARALAGVDRSDARFDPITGWVSDFVAGKPSELARR